MPTKYSTSSSVQKEFYFHLGLISTKFSIMEYNILKILGKLIIDEFVLTATLLEKNSLSQNIELLKKINRFRRYKEKSMLELIRNVSKVRQSRNLFIHGVWGEPHKSEKDVIINCSEPKLLYEENESGRTWTHRTHHKFLLSDLMKLAEDIDNIILIQTYLLENLEENPISSYF